MRIKDDQPCDRFFLFLERLCKMIGTPGGRILLVLFVMLAFYVAMLLGVREAAWPGHVSLLVLLRLARNPKNAAGVLRRLGRRITPT